jgi:isoquinoline 1-oxidoreductase beta subunit
MSQDFDALSLQDQGRRRFLKVVSLGAGGLALQISLPSPAGQLPGKVTDHGAFNPNAFVHLYENGDVTLYCGRCEMGQGISTALTSAVADEMEADWGRVTVKQAPGDEARFGPQGTGGSNSINRMFLPMRQAGAAAREMLVAAAAAAWGTDLSNCEARNHFVVNRVNGEKLAYGELAARAAQVELPGEPRLKSKDEWRYIGTRLKRHDTPLVVVGQRTYGIDTRVPGMKYAAIAHCPVLGGKLKSVDGSEALSMPGVSHVVEVEPLKVPYGSVGGVAVVADNSWTAQQGVKKLVLEWDRGPNSVYNTTQYKAGLVASVEKPAHVTAERGDLGQAFSEAGKRVSATYTGGHLCHAPMEPNASVVWVKDGECEVWASTQSPADIQKTLGQFLGIEPSKVTVHVMISGGAFGRKFKCDYVQEAAAISKAVNAPVHLAWTREEDMRTGYYHSTSAQHLEASLDSEGNVTGWLHRVAFPSIATLFQEGLERAPDNALNAVRDHPFGVANFRCESGDCVAHTRIGWYRAVYAVFYGFAFGVFADELAHAAGTDPLTMWNRLYDANGNPEQAEQVTRSKAVLALAAEKAGYGKELPEGEGIGIAAHFSFNTYAAMAVHVRVSGEDIEVLNVDCAIDCGQVLNLDSATAQMEGAVVMGMSLALRTEIRFEDGAVVNSNYHDYPVLLFHEMPNVRVHFVDSGASATGLGEPGVGPFAPALSNAIFAASGKRYRDLPMTPPA